MTPTTYNLFDEHPYDSYDNPFAEPRTVPMGWDTAAFQAPQGAEQVESGAEAGEQTDNAEQSASGPMEKFPKPSTTPKHWDVAALR